MDGMGDLDNAPMPPMGADDMGMGDPMGDEPMGDPNAMDDPNAMGDEPPMDDPNIGNGEDDELMNIINNLSIEDKAAVTKYAKSMADDSNGGNEEAQDMGGDMPMESRRSLKNIIDEALNDVINDREGTKRDERNLPKHLRKFESPFTSQWK